MQREKPSEKMQQRIFNKILRKPENSECADCPTKGPGWASLDFGIFVCMNCAGAHRSLGPTISRIKSTTLDTSWTSEYIELLDNLGNEVSNSYWEFKTPIKRPTINSNLDERIKFAVEKYVKKKYINPDVISPVQKFLQDKQNGVKHTKEMPNKNSTDIKEEKQYSSNGESVNAINNVNLLEGPSIPIVRFASYNGPKNENLIQFDDSFEEYKIANDKPKLDILTGEEINQNILDLPNIKINANNVSQQEKFNQQPNVYQNIQQSQSQSQQISQDIMQLGNIDFQQKQQQQQQVPQQQQQVPQQQQQQIPPINTKKTNDNQDRYKYFNQIYNSNQMQPVYQNQNYYGAQQYGANFYNMQYYQHMNGQHNRNNIKNQQLSLI